MTLDKAIEIISYLRKANDFDLGQDYLTALSMAEEAIGVLRALRGQGYPTKLFKPIILTGESLDECLNS